MVTLRPSLLKYTHTHTHTRPISCYQWFFLEWRDVLRVQRNCRKTSRVPAHPLSSFISTTYLSLILYFFYIIAAKTPKPTSFCTHKNLDSYSYLSFFLFCIEYWKVPLLLCVIHGLLMIAPSTIEQHFSMLYSFKRANHRVVLPRSCQ